MAVYVDTPRWFIRPRNTDWRYMNSLKKLEASGGPNAIYATDPVDIALTSAAYVQRRLGMREWNLDRKLDAQALRRRGAGAVLNHAIPPLWRRGERLPVLWRHELIDTVMMANWGISASKIAARKAHMIQFLGRADRVITATAAARDRNAEIFPAHAEKFVHVPFFLPTISAVSEADVAAKHSSPQPIRLLFIGGEGYRKGLDLVLNAWNSLPEYLAAGAKLTVVSQEMNPEWRGNRPFDYHQSLPHSEVQALMRAAQVFVMPSRQESYGFVYLEAMAAGCAIIGAHWESQREILAEGSAGINCAPEAEAVRNAMQALLQDAPLREQLGRAALARFHAEFAPGVVARRYLGLVQSCV